MGLNRGRPVLLIGLLIASACGSDTASDTQQTDAPPAVATTTAPPGSPAQDVPEALRFRAPLVGGGEIDASTLAGKPVVLWFWAPY